MKKRRKSYVVIPGDGDPCPRCGRPTQIREHKEILQRHRNQPFYYSRWFNCMFSDCRTTLVMPDRFIIWRSAEDRDAYVRRGLIRDQLSEPSL